MGKTITSLVASCLLFLTTAANVNAQAPFRNSMVPFNGKIEKMTKQDAKPRRKPWQSLRANIRCFSNGRISPPAVVILPIPTAW